MDYEAFVYLITNLKTGRAYVGRKYVYKTKKGQRAGESNWRTYFGSSKELSADVALHGAEWFRREILHFCKTRSTANYLEVKEQFDRDVLVAKLPDGTRAFYNASIMNRYFATTSASAAKVGASLKGRFRISNGVTEATIAKGESIPEGWEAGSLSRVAYDTDPKVCACGTIIPFHRRRNKVCSQACFDACRSRRLRERLDEDKRESYRQSASTRRETLAARFGHRSFRDLEIYIIEQSAHRTAKSIAQSLGCSRSWIWRLLRQINNE